MYLMPYVVPCRISEFEFYWSENRHNKSRSSKNKRFIRGNIYAYKLPYVSTLVFETKFLRRCPCRPCCATNQKEVNELTFGQRIKKIQDIMGSII